MLLQDNFHKKIVYLASNCESSRWVYNALSVNFKIDAAIIENPISKIKLTKGRIKRIGLIKVTGQVLFSAFIGGSQNLVPNGDFEFFTSCPTSFSQTNLAFPWYDPTGAHALK